VLCISACARARVFGIGIILAWTSLPILTFYSHASFLLPDLSPLHPCRSLPLPLFQSLLWSHRRRIFLQSSHLQTTSARQTPSEREANTKHRASDDENGERRTENGSEDNHRYLTWTDGVIRVD
jgi:hypothetical protein